jgi:hypothetical protein
MPPLALMTLLTFFGLLLVVALVALITAVATRGLLLRLLGFELVTRDGRCAARWRVLVRAAVAWAPILVPALASTALGGVAHGVMGLTIILCTALVVLLAGAIVAVAVPSRSLQDRLAGTWIVPR